MNRAADLALTALIAPIVALPAVAVAIAVKLTSPGPVLYWSDRVGQNNQIFQMPKFRTMKVGTPAVATHLLADPAAALTPIGAFLRKTSLDELPQLWSVMRGKMSFVGPRPALFNQDDLVALRTREGVHRLRPGITGLAQVEGRDALTIEEKVVWDASYLRQRSAGMDLRILVRTAMKLLGDRTVSH